MDQSVRSPLITALRWHLHLILFSHELFQYVASKALFSVKIIFLELFFGGTLSQISWRRNHYNLHRHRVLISLRIFEGVLSRTRHRHWVMFLISTIANHNVEISFKKIKSLFWNWKFCSVVLSQFSQIS